MKVQRKQVEQLIATASHIAELQATEAVLLRLHNATSSAARLRVLAKALTRVGDDLKSAHAHLADLLHQMSD